MHTIYIYIQYTQIATWSECIGLTLFRTLSLVQENHINSTVYSTRNRYQILDMTINSIVLSQYIRQICEFTFFKQIISYSI